MSLKNYSLKPVLQNNLKKGRSILVLPAYLSFLIPDAILFEFGPFLGNSTSV